jgi:hypothetical protein
MIWTLAGHLLVVGGRGNKERAHPQAGDERVVRGATPFRLTWASIKKPAGAATGIEGQPHSVRVRPGVGLYPLLL